MNKRLYAYEHDMPTVSIIRASAYECEKRGEAQVRFKQILQITKEDLQWCDVLSLIRPNNSYSAHLAKRAKECGCLVVTHYDDDLYNLPSSVPNPAWRKNSVRKALRNSHAITTPSRHIFEKYRDLTLWKRGYVSNSVVREEEIKKIPVKEQVDPADRVVKLIYAASPAHTGFFNQFILPIMPDLCSKYGKKISMTFMGVRPELSRFESQIDITYYSTMPLEEYRQKIQNGDYDIGLSPLTTDEFTKCKYFNKFIEYTMAGIVGVYSETEPYTYVVRHNENGFLAKDDPQDWYDCLCKVIDDSLLRNRCICTAQDLLIRKFSREYIEAVAREALPEELMSTKEKLPCKALQPAKGIYRMQCILDRVYQVLFYLKNTGFSGLIEKIQVHFREGKAYK